MNGDVFAMQVLAAAVSSTHGLWMALIALQSLRAVLQKTMQPSYAGAGGNSSKSKAVWALRCIAAIGGPLALLIRGMRAVPHSYQNDALQVSGLFRNLALAVWFACLFV